MRESDARIALLTATTALVPSGVLAKLDVVASSVVLSWMVDEAGTAVTCKIVLLKVPWYSAFRGWPFNISR